MSIQKEGDQKVFCYRNNVASNAWTSLSSSDFKSMRSGIAAKLGAEFTEVSIMNLGSVKVYVTFGYEPTVNTGVNEAINAGLLRAEGVEIAAGAFMHIELGGTAVTKVSLRTSDANTDAEVQVQGVLDIR